MKTRTLKFLFTAAMAMTLASCGGETKLEKTYITFITVGEKAAVFEKNYDGQKATFSLESVKTNSDAQLALKWYSFSTGEDGQETKTALEDGPIDAGRYLIEISAAETKKFTARTVESEFQIKAAALPESWVTKAADFPEKLGFTKSGSGRNVRRTADADQVAALKTKITVKDDQNKTWVLDTDYSITVTVSSDTVARVAVNSLTNKNYTNYSFQMTAEEIVPDPGE